MVLQAAEGVLDHVPNAVKDFVVEVLDQAVALGRDADADAAGLPVGAELIGVVSLVADHGQRLQADGERLGAGAVAALAWRGQQAADEAQAVPAVARSEPRGVVDLAGQPAARAADGLGGVAACACCCAVALDRGAVDVQHIRLSHGLRAHQQALPDALLGPAPEPLFGRLGRGDEARKLSPGAIPAQDGKAGADEAPHRVRVMQVHVRLLPQPLQHTLPQPVLDEYLSENMALNFLASGESGSRRMNCQNAASVERPSSRSLQGTSDSFNNIRTMFLDRH